MKTYSVRFNAGIEGDTSVEAESLEEAQELAHQAALDELCEYSIYQLDVTSVEEE